MIADEPAKGSRILLGARRGSGGQEGGWVVRGDGLGAEGDEVSVVGGRGGCKRVWRRRGLAGRVLCRVWRMSGAISWPLATASGNSGYCSSARYRCVVALISSAKA